MFCIVVTLFIGIDKKVKVIKATIESSSSSSSGSNKSKSKKSKSSDSVSLSTVGVLNHNAKINVLKTLWNESQFDSIFGSVSGSVDISVEEFGSDSLIDITNALPICIGDTSNSISVYYGKP